MEISDVFAVNHKDEPDGRVRSRHIESSSSPLNRPKHYRSLQEVIYRHPYIERKNNFRERGDDGPGVPQENVPVEAQGPLLLESF